MRDTISAGTVGSRGDTHDEEHRTEGLRILARIIARMNLGHIRMEAEEHYEMAEAHEKPGKEVLFLSGGERAVPPRRKDKLSENRR